METLSDVEHPLVRLTAMQLTTGASELRDKLALIFRFERDEIVFGFPPESDIVKASQTIQRGYGQCNTKGILFLALCKTVGIPAQQHFSRISKEIQHGFFQCLFYWAMPSEITHSWLEVELDGKWRQVDTYINDVILHNAAVRKLKHSNWKTGYSISREAGEPSADLGLNDTHFSQMGAVVGDHGTWEEPAEFLNGPDYLNRPSMIKQFLYQLYQLLANSHVRRLRESDISLRVEKRQS